MSFGKSGGMSVAATNPVRTRRKTRLASRNNSLAQMNKSPERGTATEKRHPQVGKSREVCRCRTKARNRGVWGTEGAAGARGIRPARMAFKNAARKSKGRRKAGLL